MSIIHYENYVQDYNLKQNKFFLLCGNCLWMASTISTLSDLCLIRYKKCPICIDKVYRFLICDAAVE